MRFLSSARALPFALLLLVACSSPPPSGGGGAGGGGGASTDCLITGCGQTEACVNGSCLPRSCSDAVCGTDEVCSDGKCTPKSCVGQSCPSGTVCIPGGTCAPQACGDGGFCGSDQVCTDQGCVDSRCVGLTCQSGEVCANGRCYAPSCGGIACGAGFVCDNGCVETVCAGIICPGGARCTGGVCSTSCGTVNCDQPPADACDGSGIRHYQPFGSCDPQSASCSYSSSLESCDAPPSNSCADPQTARTYSGAGSCDAGACEYVPTDVPCNAPPAASCLNATTLRTWNAQGSCDAGACEYVSTDTSCPVSCSNGACLGGAKVFQQVGPALPGEVTALEIPPGGDGGLVVVVGKGGFASQWNGSDWRSIDAGTGNDLNSIWLSSADGGYAVGAAKTILRYDGTGLAPIAVAGPSANLVSVHGNSPSHVLIASETTNYWRFDGASWTTGILPGTNSPTMRVAHVAANDRERIGGACVIFNTTYGCIATAPSQTGIWTMSGIGGGGSNLARVDAITSVGCCTTAAVVGGVQTVNFHTDSNTFTTSCSCNASSLTYGTYSPGEINGLARGGTQAELMINTGDTPDAGLGGRLFDDPGLAGNPTARLETHASSAMSRNFGQVFAVSDATPRATTVFLATNFGSVEKAIALGEDWQRAAVLGTGTTVLMNAKGDLARISASGAILNFVRSIAARPNMYALVAGSNYSITGGAGGVVQRHNNGGNAMSQVTSTGLLKTWRAGCRVSDTEMYLVGDNGQTALYDGTNLTGISSGTTANLYDVYCIGTDSAVAVGEGSTVLKLAGGVWSPVTPALTSGGQLTSVQVDSNGDIYVGGSGYFGRYSGGSWTALSTLTGLNGLVVLSSTEAYAFAAGGSSGGKVISKFDGQSWSQVATSTQPLLDGTSGAGQVVFVGLGGAIVRGQ